MAGSKDIDETAWEWFSDTFVEKQEILMKKVCLISQQSCHFLPEDMNQGTLLMFVELACFSVCFPLNLCI
jgi:hypothetical protein